MPVCQYHFLCLDYIFYLSFRFDVLTLAALLPRHSSINLFSWSKSIVCSMFAVMLLFCSSLYLSLWVLYIYLCLLCFLECELHIFGHPHLANNGKYIDLLQMGRHCQSTTIEFLPMNPEAACERDDYSIMLSNCQFFTCTNHGNNPISKLTSRLENFWIIWRV